MRRLFVALNSFHQFLRPQSIYSKGRQVLRYSDQYELLYNRSLELVFGHSRRFLYRLGNPRGASPMKTLHVTEYCHAGSVGGTERYVHDLVTQLTGMGIDGAIVWLTQDQRRKQMDSEGVRILALPAPPMRVDAPLPGFDAKAIELLDAEKPEWLHFHTFGMTEARLAALARERGIPYAFTYHSPAWTCRRETMLLYGGEPCDGEVRPWRCSVCQTEERLSGGLLTAHTATAASFAIGWASIPLGRTSLRRRTAFYHDTRRYAHSLRRFLGRCDVVISCAEWCIPVLQRNGANPKSIIHRPQGVSDRFLETLAGEVHAGSVKQEHFTIGCIGRVSPVKGIHILIEGFSMFDSPRARLRIVGWELDHKDAAYSKTIQELAGKDSRVSLVPKTDQMGALKEMRGLNLLAIPSIWLETGPLTLMEALACGVPVFGSHRIGQIELLRKHGRVVDPNTPESWCEALAEAVRARSEHQNPTLPAPRTMSDVAREMAAEYAKAQDK